MTIAVTYDDGNIFQHFGHTERFKLYEVKEGQIVESKVVNADGFGHDALAGFLKGLHVDAVICGGIGGGARQALQDAGIALYGGVTGPADEAAAALAAGTLQYNPDILCAHHGQSHACGGEHHCH